MTILSDAHGSPTPAWIVTVIVQGSSRSIVVGSGEIARSDALRRVGSATARSERKWMALWCSRCTCMIYLSNSITQDTPIPCMISISTCQGTWKTHMLTQTHLWQSRQSKYGHIMLLTHHKPPQPRTSSLGLICVPMLTCGEAKGSAKSCPATDPGDRNHELRRLERRSGSDRAGQERGVRAAARLGARACQMPRPARAPAACSAAVPRRGGRPRCISAGRA